MSNNKSSLPRGIGWGIFILITVFAGWVVFAFVSAHDRASQVVVRNLENLKGGAEDLARLDADSASKKFSDVAGEIGTLDALFGGFSSVIGGAGEAISGLHSIASNAATLAQEIDFMKREFFGLFLGGGGDRIVGGLENIKSSIAGIKDGSEKIASLGEKLGETEVLVREFYLPLGLEFSRYLDFLDAFLPWISSESGTRVLVLLLNPSEIRPGGGFLGSYADVLIKGGELAGIEVLDINDVSNSLDKKIVPPRPLQAILRSWSAADSNWFFDFSSSARKTKEFFESSDLYAGKEDFDAVIALSPKVIEDILRLSGPIEVGDGKLVLDEDNFLVELQRIVQEGQASDATYPKKILEEAAPVVFSRLGALPTEQKNEFWNSAFGWIKNRDLMFYFEDSGLREFARHNGATGEISGLPDKFNGDYLAIVDANIDGGKSDLFIKQEVLLESQLNLDGTTSNHLVINRTHEGNKSKYWWYKETNQNYIQIFLSPSAQLANVQGGIDKKITPKVDYSKGGYADDPDVAAIESTTEKLFNHPSVEVHKEGGKKVFSTWSATKAGGKTQLVFDYTQRTSVPVSDGTKYQFIFEKQMGTSRSYKFQISAPVGFRFEENGLPVFSYESKDVPGRLVLDLTLEKI